MNLENINWIVQVLVPILAFITGLMLGYFIGRKSEKDAIPRLLFSFIVVLVWASRLIFSISNPNIEISTWEHILTGIIVVTFVQPPKSSLEILGLIKDKILAKDNDKK